MNFSRAPGTIIARPRLERGSTFSSMNSSIQSTELLRNSGSVSRIPSHHSASPRDPPLPSPDLAPEGPPRLRPIIGRPRAGRNRSKRLFESLGRSAPRLNASGRTPHRGPSAAHAWKRPLPNVPGDLRRHWRPLRAHAAAAAFSTSTSCYPPHAAKETRVGAMATSPHLYCACPASTVPVSRAGLARGDRRIVMEKPLGHSKSSRGDQRRGRVFASTIFGRRNPLEAALRQHLRLYLLFDTRRSPWPRPRGSAPALLRRLQAAIWCRTTLQRSCLVLREAGRSGGLGARREGEVLRRATSMPELQQRRANGVGVVEKSPALAQG